MVLHFFLNFLVGFIQLLTRLCGLIMVSHFQIRNYAPDLAQTIAGLILSSSDLNFQRECFSLLGLQSQDVGTEIVQNSIKEKIVSVIEMNDKDPDKSKEIAPFLFEEDDHIQEELEGEFQESYLSPLDLDIDMF